MGNKETADKVVDLAKLKSEREAAELKRKFEHGKGKGNGAVCHLTADQYDLMSRTAHEICISAYKGDKHYGYDYVDNLAEYVAILMGIYPKRDLLKYAWYKATEFDGTGNEADINILIEILIGKFTYDKHACLKEAGEKAKDFTKEQIDFLKTVVGASDPRKREKLLEPLEALRRDMVRVGPSKL